MNNFENICFEITSNTSQLTLDEKLYKLNELKKHIKKDFIDIDLIDQYFNLIFTILNQKSLKYEQFINTAYSILCYLIKRIYIQDKTKLVYSANSQYLHDCLIWLSIKCDTDNNSKKALFCLYTVQETNVFVKMLCDNVNNFINIKNMLRFVFETIIESYDAKDHERAVNKYQPFFDLVDKDAQEYVQRWMTKLNINKVVHNTNSLNDFMLTMRSPELEKHAVDSNLFKERHFNSTPTFNRYMKTTFDQSLFQTKESESNWKQRLNYLTSLIVNIQKFKDEFTVTDEILMNVLTCSSSLRTSLTLNALKFMSLVFESNNNVTISEGIMLKILMQMYQLIQTNKKILFTAENDVFCKSVKYYVKSKYSSMKLFKIINSLCSDKNILCVSCAVDYLTLLYLCVDDYIKNSSNCTRRDQLYYVALNDEENDNYQILMSSIQLNKVNEPIGVYLFKKLLNNTSGQVKVKLRKNFWEYMSAEIREKYIIQYLDSSELKKASIGHENELVKTNSLKKSNVFEQRSPVYNSSNKIASLEPTPVPEVRNNKTKRNDENDLYLDDLELLDIDILPQYEMTMIPFKKRKTLFEDEKENIDSRVSSGETVVNAKFDHQSIDLSCLGISNINATGFKQFEQKCVEFLLGNLVSREQDIDTRLSYFLNKEDIKLSFKLLILLNEGVSFNDQIEAFIANSFQTIEENSAKQIDTLSEILLITKLCKKHGLNPLNYITDDSLYRFTKI